MKKYFYILIACILAISCSKSEPQLDRTIFIPDEENPNLPAYTEAGYNSFGAKYERQYFLATNNNIPCKIVYNNDSLSFWLIGAINGSNAVLTVTFPSAPVKTPDDLQILNNLQIDLSQGSVVKFTSNYTPTILNVSGGTLYFKRFQSLSIDDKFNRIILSGTFDIRFMNNGFPESLSDGRFDLGITGNDFQSYAQ